MKIESISSQVTIEAERFQLRQIRPSDAGLIEMFAGDERVARNTASIPHPLPPGATDAFIARATDPQRAEDVWAIDGTRSGGAEIMGVISLERMDRDQSEIGFWVAPAFWNTGVASAAVAVLLETNPQNCKTIFASVFQDNPASARVLTNCGFSYLGDAECYSVARQAKVPTWTYSFKTD